MVETRSVDTANDWEILAVVNDSIVDLLHTLLGHLPSGRFETRPDCRAFVLALYQTHGFNLSLIVDGRRPEARDLIMILRGLGITDAYLGPGLTAVDISSEAEAKFEALLSSVRPALGELAQGKLGLTPWTPEYEKLNASDDTRRHLNDLALPQAGSAGVPSLLLHGLGTVNPSNRDAVDNLLNFMTADHKYFINAAGSGKTRLCLEAMCEKYGFYFTCADPRSTLSSAFADVREALEIGSCDLFNVFNELTESISQQDLSTVPPDSRLQTAQRNSDKARHLLRRVLAARLCLLAEYLETAHTHVVIDTMESRRAWTHLQVQPHILRIPQADVFASLAEALRYASDAYIVALADRSLKRIQALLYPKVLYEGFNVKIPTVIDEAQEGLYQLPDAFLSPSSRDGNGDLPARPFLREVAAHWSTFHANRCSVQFIITGSDVYLDHFLRETRHGGKWGQPRLWTEVRFMGAFRGRDEQHAYLSRYFPASMLDEPDGKVLLERVWYWLRGRHRLTASFVQYLLGCAVLDGSRANVLLNMYIRGLASFHPLDAMSQKYPRDLTGIPLPEYFAIEFEKLDMDCIESLRDDVYHRMVRGLKPWYVKDVTGSLLRVGLGQRGESFAVKIYEPLILMAAFTWFNRSAHALEVEDPLREVPSLFCSLVKSLRSHDSEDGWKNLLAYYFSRVFSASTRSDLSDVFTFPLNSTPSELGSCRATLMSFYSNNGVHLEGSFDYPPSPGYPGTLGLSAESDSVFVFEAPDVLRHKTETPTSIYFPGDYMGPDLVFVLKLEKEGCDASTYLWVAVQAELGTRELTEAIDSVTPKNFFTNSGKPERVRQRINKFAYYMQEHQYKEHTLNALKDGLPKGKATPNAGAYSLLRVVAQFPRPVNLESVFDRDEDDKHPLVALDIENLKRTTEHQFPFNALQGFERDEMALKRKRTPEADLAVDHDDGVDCDNEGPRKRARQDNEEDKDTTERDEYNA